MPERLMTEATLNILLRKKEEIELQLHTLGSQMSGDQRSAIHDDPSIESRRNLLRGTLIRIGNLSSVRLIHPRKQTDIIDLGNKVIVKFEEGDEESMLLLSPDDVIYLNDVGPIISYESPLGKVITGKRKDNIVAFTVAQVKTQTVKILEILEGDF